jgi:hypothetical protein
MMFSEEKEMLQSGLGFEKMDDRLIIPLDKLPEYAGAYLD